MTRIAAVLMGLLAIASVSASTQTPGSPQRDGPEPRPRIGPSSAEIAKLFSAYGYSRNTEAQKLSTLIAAARQAFWAEYPNGPKFKEVERDFVKKLTEKDLLFALVLVDAQGSCTDEQILRAKVGGIWQVDGGIPTSAWTLFCDWMGAIRRRRVPMLADLPNMVPNMLAVPEFETYRQQRDWAELVRAGVTPYRTWVDLFTSTDPAVYLMGLTFSSYPDGSSRDQRESFPARLELVYETVRAMEKQHGRDRLLKLSDQLMRAPKRSTSPATLAGRRLTDDAARELGCGWIDVAPCFWDIVKKWPTFVPVSVAPPARPADAGPPSDTERARWEALATSTDPIEYARYLLWFLIEQAHPTATPDERRDVATKDFDAKTKQYGTAAMARTAQAVRAAYKTPNGDLIDDSALRLGCDVCSDAEGGCKPASCFHELLSRRGGPLQLPTDPPRPGQLPWKVKHVSPVFPSTAAGTRFQIVAVQLTVGVDGRVTSAKALRGHPDFHQAALDAVRQWEFASAGMTAPGTGQMNVIFRRR
jgi:TonB family protein